MRTGVDHVGWKNLPDDYPSVISATWPTQQSFNLVLVLHQRLLSSCLCPVGKFLSIYQPLSSQSLMIFTLYAWLQYFKHAITACAEVCQRASATKGVVYLLEPETELSQESLDVFHSFLSPIYFSVFDFHFLSTFGLVTDTIALFHIRNVNICISQCYELSTRMQLKR